MARRTEAIALLLVMALALVPARADAASSEVALATRCRKAFTVQGRSYSQKRLGYVLGCADKLLKCELRNEIDGIDPTSCRVAVTTSCEGRLGAALAKVADRFDAKVGVVCETATFSYANVLSTGPGGLWFGNDGCASEIDLPSFLPCLRNQVDARMDALVSAAKPRTGIVLDNAGLGGAFPHLLRPPMVDRLVTATAPASGTLVDPGTIAVPPGSALRFAGNVATLGCSVSGTDGRVIITVGAGPTAQRHELREPYGANAVAIFGPWDVPGSIPYSIALADGSCNDTVTGTVSVP